MKKIFDVPLLIMAVIALALGVACYIVLGRAAFIDAFREDVDLLLMLLPKISAAFFLAGFLQVLLPRDKVARWMGEKSGVRGMALAAAAGAATPGGPMTSFPLVTALQAAGTGRAALVAYITSWSTLGFQRILTWELPLLGAEFAFVRFMASLPLWLIAGLMSKLVPFETPPLEPKLAAGTKSAAKTSQVDRAADDV